MRRQRVNGVPRWCRVGVAQISDEVAGAKLGLLQLESWISDEVALIGRALIEG